MINENNKHSWCVNADHAMSGDNTGTTKICCMTDDKTRSKSLLDSTIEENFNQEKFLEVRTALASGERHDICKLCWAEENSGRKSKRLRDNEKYLNHLQNGGKPFEGLAKFELNLGNTCNLKCRTCAPHSSSQWIKEKFDIIETDAWKGDFKAYSNEMKKYHMTYDEDSVFWDDLEKNLHTIKQFDFYGGEPFMSKKMWRILEICIDLDYAKDIELHYATNATHWPEKQIELFHHFRHVNLNFSIDGIGDQFTYMRHPGKWEDASTNMNKAKDLQHTHHNIHISWCITVSLLNIFSISDVLEEHKNNYSSFGSYLNLVHSPEYFNIGIMPDDVKEQVIAKLESIPRHHTDMWYHHLPGVINFIRNGKHNSKLWEEFKQKIQVHDIYRDEQYSKVFPDFAKIIGL